MRADRRCSWVLAALWMACIAGCGSGGGEDRDDDDDGDETESSNVTNTLYRVPVPEELEPWASYPVEVAEFSREEGDTVKIEYLFPTWLVGLGQEVELVGQFPAGATSFPVSAGAYGDGTCAVEGRRMVCTEHLPGLVVDRARAEALMQEHGLAAGDITQRLRVTDVFSVDPIGIFEFDLP